MAPPARYDWHRWFKHRSFTLRRGKHYTCMPHSMSVLIRNAAARRNIRVSVCINEDGTITVTKKD